jgi:hypothetical protein
MCEHPEHHSVGVTQPQPASGDARHMSMHVSHTTGGAAQPVYEIRVKGAVGRALAGEFQPLEACTQTVLRGSLPDQAALHGVLDRIRDLGLELVDVHQVDDR